MRDVLHKLAMRLGCKTLPELWIIAAAMTLATVVALLVFDGPPKWQIFAVDVTEASYPVAFLAIAIVGLLERLSNLQRER